MRRKSIEDRFILQMVEVIVVRSHVEHLLYPVAGVEPVTIPPSHATSLLMTMESVCVCGDGVDFYYFFLAGACPH